jgi:hypothetical protein
VAGDTPEPDYEPTDSSDDAHEHGVVFAQVEDEIPLRVEDLDDDDDEDPELTA